VIFVDTGYLIALYDPGDQLFPRAAAWAEALDEPLLVSGFVLVETLNFFSRPGRRPRGHAMIESIEADHGFTIIPVSDELFKAGYAIHRDRPDKAWSLTDCTSFHLMRVGGIRQALTHDQHFEQAGFEAPLRRDP
jgi:uncharacterized protein